MLDIATAVGTYFGTRAPAEVAVAYLFGSHGTGRSHSESDVDVGVVVDRVALPERADRSRLAVGLAGELIAVTHINEVDVIVLNDATPELAAHVVRQGRRVYCRDAAQDHAFVRTALLRNADLRPFLERTRRTKLRTLAR